MTAQDTAAAERIVPVGDSTTASKTGWDDAFARLLAPGVECVNLGRGGRSSTSYRAEGHWQKAPLLDLNARSIEQVNKLGPEAAAAFDAKPEDKTHFNSKGADATARLAAGEIRKNVPELGKLLAQ